MTEYIKIVTRLINLCLILALAGCASALPELTMDAAVESEASDFRLAPGDTVSIFVWRNPELSVTVPIRPDGRITIPLVEDLTASGKTPHELAREIETNLGAFVKSPVVTVILTSNGSANGQQVRVIGAAVKPQSIPYRDGMTLLDVMITAGGLSDFAAGNRASLVRTVNGQSQQFHARLEDLLKKGDIGANARMHPGDILIIPEARF